MTTAVQTRTVYALPVVDGYLTIGPFSQRVGISVDLLRAWERRYGLPRPTRTANGRRLYTDADLHLVTAMRRALGRGMPAAEAARVAASTPVEHAAAIDAGGSWACSRAACAMRSPPSTTRAPKSNSTACSAPAPSTPR
jgi:DNA-binding transcriptional MerR regulator